jgi:hypothetical protein
MIETRIKELNQGDVFLFGEVTFELVLPAAPTNHEMALCRITNQCANLYISADAWVIPIKSNQILD